MSNEPRMVSVRESVLDRINNMPLDVVLQRLRDIREQHGGEALLKIEIHESWGDTEAEAYVLRFRPENEQETTSRKEAEARTKLRVEQSELETYLKLKQKFGQ